MVTKGDIDKILGDVNRILAGYDTRIADLEKLIKQESLVKTTTSAKPVGRPKNKA
jgi:hypothetical protein